MARIAKHHILIQVVKGIALPGFLMAWCTWYFTSDTDHYETAIAITAAVFFIAVISRWFVEQDRLETADELD